MDLNPCIPSCWSFDGEKSSKQHEKGLDLYQSFRNYYAAWPLQRAAVCIVTNHRLQTAAREVSKIYTRYVPLHICFYMHPILSLSLLQLSLQTQIHRQQQAPAAQEWKGEHASGAEDKKKEHSALASVVVDTLAKSTKWYAASPAGKTEHTHTHPPTHTHTDTH